jgi:hypothetical protein
MQHIRQHGNFCGHSIKRLASRRKGAGESAGEGSRRKAAGGGSEECLDPTANIIANCSLNRYHETGKMAAGAGWGFEHDRHGN